MDEDGWAFANVDPFPGAEDDPFHDSKHLKDVYLRVQPDYEGRQAHIFIIVARVGDSLPIRFTVPLLWDKKLEQIVNNESSEIIRIFNSAFNDLLPADKAAIDIYPEALRPEIEGINEWVYDKLNSQCYLSNSPHSKFFNFLKITDGVYKSVFATTQEAYEKAVIPVFEALDRIEKLLEGKDYLVGGALSEADIRLYVSVVCAYRHSKL